MSEDINMADVFDLPIRENVIQHLGFVKKADCSSKYAAHAINNHDKLTQQVKELRAALKELIDKASDNSGGWTEVETCYVYKAFKAIKDSE